MLGYVVRRLGQAVVVLLGVSVITFALVHLVPGDPVRLALGTRFDPETYAALRARAGLDDPLGVQYLNWLTNAVTGDLGVSFSTGRPVSETILERLPATLLLGFGGLVVALVVAVPLGIAGALKPRTWADYAGTVFSQAGVSIPDFWMGIMLVLLLSATLGLLPPFGYTPITEDLGDGLRRLIMPALTIGVVSGSVITRFVRASVLEAMSEDYVRTARAKGLRERLVVNRHALRNALIPIVTVTGLQLGFMLGGVIVVEIVFSWPGLGQLTQIAIDRRDYSILQGVILVIASIFVVINLLVDLAYAALDPRIRLR